MNQPVGIQRKREANPTDFASMRLEAIELLQKLCGENWTDFNIHDPGVTLMEQIVFALSELCYKTSFDIADYIKGNYDKECLYMPSQSDVFCPVTSGDFERYFLSKLSDIEGAAVRKTSKSGFTVLLLASECVESSEYVVIHKNALSLWKKTQNVGEKLDSLTIISPKDAKKIHWRTRKGAVSESPALPKVISRDIRNFPPILDQFPAIYREGKNASVLSDFLKPIESLFREFLEYVDGFSRLYSLDSDESESGNLGAGLEKVNKVLNQMLALYGVRFPEELFMLLHGNSSKGLLEMVHAKKKYLRNLPILSKARGGGKLLLCLETMLDMPHSFAYADGTLVGMPGVVYMVFSVEYPCYKSVQVRRALENFIRNEMPAHLALAIYWVSESNLKIFRLISNRPDMLKKWLEVVKVHRNSAAKENRS